MGEIYRIIYSKRHRVNAFVFEARYTHEEPR